MWFCTLFVSRKTRPACRPAGFRPRLEPLDDRCLPSFSPAVSYAAGLDPHAIVSADFNGDGRLDLAETNSNDSTVSVLLGNGDGTFQAPRTSATNSPGSLVVGDFDGNGRLDLAKVDNDGLSILLGNGDGTFQLPQSVSLAPPPTSVLFTRYYATDVAIADINSDGKADLVVSGEYWWYADAETGGLGGYVSAYLGDGAGTFSASYASDVGIDHSLAAIAAADVNADGKADMVTADGSAVRVCYGLGDGTFTAGQTFVASANQSLADVIVADFNGDGKQDIATLISSTANYASNGGSVLLSNGNGTFQPYRSYVSGSDPRMLAAADFNGDGKVDLITANGGNSQQGVGPSVSICLGNGDGTFQTALNDGLTFYPSSAAVGDFNGDRSPDVAVAGARLNGDLKSVSVLLNDGIWTSASISDVTVTEGNTGTRSATFTVTLAAASGQTVTVAYATADGTATAGSDYQAKSGTLTFAPGETSKTITVLVNGDRLAEPNESFFVNLSSPTNAVINDGQGVGTILDDEPRISVGDVAKKEGRSGTTLFVFTVTLSAAYDQAVTMSFRTVDGTATTGDGDYVAKTGTLTFAPGETTKTITIEVKGDSKKESDETFYLDLFGNSGNSLFTKNRGLGTIQNDD